MGGGKGAQMRRTLLIGLFGLAPVITMQPGVAASPPSITLEHSAPLPCTVACAYWDVAGATGANECSAPFPSGSYDKTLLRLTSQRGVAHFEMRSEIDYDTFFCTNTDPPVLIHDLAQHVGPADCAGIAGIDHDVLAVGCLEFRDLTYSGLVAANGGVNEMEFIVISYNWSDPGSLPVHIWGPVEVLDDSFEASIT